MAAKSVTTEVAASPSPLGNLLRLAHALRNSLRRHFSLQVLRRALMTAAAIVATGCAGTNFTGNPKDNDDGIRYYVRKLPCVLIYSDGKGGLAAEQIAVTDTTEMWAADPYAIFAQNDANFKFKDGVLKEQAANVDTTILPQATLDALKAVAGVAANALLDQQGKPGFPVVSMPPPALYCVDNAKTAASPTHLSFVGGYAGGPGTNQIRINVTVNPEAQGSSNPPKPETKPPSEKAE